jgi:hypothetical protein
MNLIKGICILGIISVVFLFTNSCKKSDKDTETKYLRATIKNLDVDDNVRWIIILPGLGCHGCIQEGESFMKEYVGNMEILFVLTNISSLKILQQKTGIKLKEYSNIFIDIDNKIIIPTGNNIYPCIIRIEEGENAEHEFQSPSNSEAFERLKGHIMKQ